MVGWFIVWLIGWMVVCLVGRAVGCCGWLIVGGGSLLGVIGCYDASNRFLFLFVLFDTCSPI